MTDTAARLAAAGLKVKPLEWKQGVTTWGKRQQDGSLIEKPVAEFWDASTILLRGSYRIMRLADQRFVNKDSEPFRLWLRAEDAKFPDLEAAKAAAQADYEARILAALTGDSHE